MERITVVELVDFRRKDTDRGRKRFAYKLKNRKIKEKPKNEDKDDGGDYWVTSTACIANVFKKEKNDLYDIKINELIEKIQANEHKNAKTMFQRNIDILNNFQDFNFDEIRPNKILKFEKVQKVHKIIELNNFPIYLNPNVLFSHQRNGKNELGAIWLVPKLDGYKRNELGMFCEILYKFLLKNYSDRYQISEDLCVTIDTYNSQKVIYKEMISGNIPFLIEKTLDEIKRL